MSYKRPKIVLTSTTLGLLSSLFLESITSFGFSPSALNLSSLAFRALVLGPIILLIVLWWTMGRRMFRRNLLPDTNAQSWQYAAEGALNVACRYAGENSNLHGKVLRLRKKPRTIQSFSSSSNLADTTTDAEDDDDSDMGEEDLEETLTQANDFIESVMVPLLSRKYVAKSQVVQIDARFIDALAEKIDPHRPSKRREAAALHRNAGVGLLMSDSARIPCGCGSSCSSYCFEIKPKWGFLSTENSEWAVKHYVDRFTMHQKLKKAIDPNAEESEYCPLDLFHGGKDGIRRSLEKLERTPQNNLRLFVNGKLMFPTTQHRPLRQVMDESNCNVDDLFDGISEALTKEDILFRLLKAQTIGPLNDIETVYPIYLDMVHMGESVANVHLGYDVHRTPTVPPVTMEDRVEIVKRFLISCTARDCSLMMTFSQCRHPERTPLGQCLNGRWSYEITVVDLDAKPIAKMPHYFEVDRDIAKNYTEFIERQRGNIPHLAKNVPREESMTYAEEKSGLAMTYAEEKSGLGSPMSKTSISSIETKDGEEKTKQ